MMGIMMEAVVMALMVGGIIGAITALQVNNNQKKVPVKIEQRRSPRGRHIR